VPRNVPIFDARHADISTPRVVVGGRRWPRVASSTMGTKAERRQARERVAAYHEACLGQLVAHVANVLDGYRAGELDAYAVDETIHHYHRAAGELWKFCWASGSSTHLELIARLIDEQTANGETTDWWQDGAPRTH
jgi:hypothetical protein